MYNRFCPYSYAFNLLPSLCGKQFSNPKVFHMSVQKLGFSEISKKAWDKSKKHFCPSLFSLQFLKPKRLLSRPLFRNDHLFFLWSLVFSETKNVSSKDKMMTTEPHFC